jgi:adenosylhomocysteine nucleosidase
MDVRACYAVAPVNAKRVSSRLAAAALGVLLTACTSGEAARPRPVVVQGAMDVEIKTLAASLQDATEEHVAGWTFWRGTIDGYPVVVSKTQKGTANAAAATMLAVERYQPAAIINQGTAGGHAPELHVFDIVLGVDTVNLGSFKTAYRGRGEGSNHADWAPLDLMRSEGSAGVDPKALKMRRLPGDEGLLAAARSVRDQYKQGHVVDGVIGSSDVWNNELDRIQRFHDEYGTSAEEMEAAAGAQIAGQFHVPFLGIRVLSNNITNGEPYNPRVGDACQAFVRQVVQAYIKQQGKR